MVREFLKVKDDPEMLHNFVNSWLAEPWEDTKLKTSAELVLERQTETPAWQLPSWTKLLTGGIDVQERLHLLDHPGLGGPHDQPVRGPRPGPVGGGAGTGDGHRLSAAVGGAL